MKKLDAVIRKYTEVLSTLFIYGYRKVTEHQTKNGRKIQRVKVPDSLLFKRSIVVAGKAEGSVKISK